MPNQGRRPPVTALRRRLVLCLLAAGFGWPSLVASAAPLPDRAPPTGFSSANGAAGGRTLAGTFSGNARSAAAVRAGMLRILRGYFDSAPAVSGAVGDPADRGIMAFFDARLQSTPVRGAAQVQLNDGGGGGVAVMFYRPGDIGRSFGPMARQLGSVRVPGGEASRRVTLQQQTTPDGKATIGVPTGWRITGRGNGAVDVAGPQGQLVDVGIFLPIMVQPTFVGPVAGAIYLPFIADPAIAVRAVSEAQSRQAAARGVPAVTDIEVLDRSPTPPPTGSGPPASLFARSRIGGRPAPPLRPGQHRADRRRFVDLLLLHRGRAGRRLPARLPPDARRVALVVAQPADAARPDAGRGDQDAPDRRDPEERRAGTERGVRSGQQGLQLLSPRCRGARAHPVRRPRQLRPRLRRRGGPRRSHQVPPGPAEPVPDRRLAVVESPPCRHPRASTSTRTSSPSASSARSRRAARPPAARSTGRIRAAPRSW